MSSLKIGYTVDAKHLGPNEINTFSFMPDRQRIIYRNVSKPKDSLLIFAASWCKYCDTLKQNLIALEKKTKGKVPLVMVDIDQAPNIVQAFKATGFPIPHYPTIYLIRAATGEVLKPRYEGDRDPDALISFLCAADRQSSSFFSLSSSRLYPSLARRM